MTLTEARKVLGLGPDEDPRPHLGEFRSTRERMAAMVRTAPNDTLALRYQDSLVEFDKALAAVRESLETSEASVKNTPTTPEPGSESTTPPRKGPALFLWLLIFLIAGGAGAWFYLKIEEDRELQRQSRIAFLQRQSALFIENRRWPDAKKILDEIAGLEPGSELLVQGRRAIEAGMAEEQSQFISYWTGEANSAIEVGRWDDAEKSVRQILDKFPDNKETAALLDRIAAARIAEKRSKALASARAKLDARDWDAALTATRAILLDHPGDEDAQILLTEIEAAKTKAAADLVTARDLLAKAIARDQGHFDQEALDWLREAATLAPDDSEIAARLEKMSSYSRTLRVPGDFETPAEAIAGARARDRVLLAAGTWTGPLIINSTIELQGTGTAHTIVECPADAGCTITFGPDAKDARVTGITFRHSSFEAGPERFSAALVRGGDVTFSECQFSDASGHGLIVIEAGRAAASRCRFADNGWNGAAATGPGSRLEVRDSESRGNFEHGIEAWDGASAILSGNRCTTNSRNGIHIDIGESTATIENNLLAENREFGLIIGSAGRGRATGNTSRGNLLGGIVIRTRAHSVATTGNEITRNQGPGLVLETGLHPLAYADNTITSNQGRPVLPNTDFSEEETNIPDLPPPDPLPDLLDLPEPVIEPHE